MTSENEGASQSVWPSCEHSSVHTATTAPLRPAFLHAEGDLPPRFLDYAKHVYLSAD